MQKQVSKQSLAVLALSILLAISMALTATFAAFTDNKTVTGTITFDGSLTITLGASVVKTDGVTITLAENGENAAILFEQEAFEWDSTNNVYKLTDAAKAVLSAYQITIESGVTKDYYYKVIAAEETITGVTITCAEHNVANQLVANGAVTTLNMGSILTEVTIGDTADAMNGTQFVRVSFDASYTTFAA